MVIRQPLWHSYHGDALADNEPMGVAAALSVTCYFEVLLLPLVLVGNDSCCWGWLRGQRHGVVLPRPPPGGRPPRPEESARAARPATIIGRAGLFLLSCFPLYRRVVVRSTKATATVNSQWWFPATASSSTLLHYYYCCCSSISILYTGWAGI